MPQEERASPVVVTPDGICAPRWRALLEARWRGRLQEVIELSLAYHGAAAAAPEGRDGRAGPQETRRLLGRAIAARRKLADVDDALGRLATGTFGRCEQCGSQIPAGLLAVIPERRYCPRCETETDPAPALSGHAEA
jgi:RNA polymerase-binding transcription factor DksA